MRTRYSFYCYEAMLYVFGNCLDKVCKVLISKHFYSCRRYSSYITSHLYRPLNPWLANALLLLTIARHLVNAKQEADNFFFNISCAALPLT